MNKIDIDPILLRMHRTMENLKFIEDGPLDPESKVPPYEVTQLVNSFLGALVHPWEKNRDLFKEPIEDAVKNGWPSIESEIAEDRQPKTLGDLIKQMRNAMAHGNVSYIPEAEEKITAIRMVNIDPRCEHRVWGAKVAVEDMRTFLQMFVDSFPRKMKEALKSGH